MERLKFCEGIDYERGGLKEEDWCGTIIGGVENWGEINGFALQFFQNFASFKRYQPLKFKIFYFLSSLVVVWTYFGRSFGRTFFLDFHVMDCLPVLYGNLLIC